MAAGEVLACSISGNSATNGGGMADGSENYGNGASLTLTNCIVTGNKAVGGAGGDGIGGGLAVENNSTATISNTSFVGNLAQGGAGGRGGQRR